MVNVKPQRERWGNSGQDLIKERGQSLEFEFSQQGPSQHSCLENPIDGGAWCAAVHGVAKSRT